MPRISEESRRRRDRVLRNQEQITTRYAQGVSLTRIAADYSVESKWFRAVLVGWGVEIRGPRAARAAHLALRQRH
ncbi:hypothetical protein ACFVIM_07145 [Streptomyces sp. NPDC057638]|uniref:hypothetical protein n=1 Tax=Streptomyces sp. NPDC057638 TaxID=3346190 RepID=UPI0036CF13B8